MAVVRESFLGAVELIMAWEDCSITDVKCQTRRLCGHDERQSEEPGVSNQVGSHWITSG